MWIRLGDEKRAQHGLLWEGITCIEGDTAQVVSVKLHLMFIPLGNKMFVLVSDFTLNLSHFEFLISINLTKK